MMKLLTRVLATAAIAVAPAVATAQTPVTLTITGQTIDAGPNGGQFSVSAPASLGNFLAYCVDRERGFQYNTAYNYRVYTFAAFVAATFTPGTGLQNAQYINELNKMAINAGVIAANGATKDAAQLNTWAMFAGAGDGSGGVFAATDNWRIFVSEDAINSQGTLNADRRYGTQTLIATVPEPSTYLLMGVGLFAVGIASKRRRIA
jgi:hypothetical protein